MKICPRCKGNATEDLGNGVEVTCSECEGQRFVADNGLYAYPPPAMRGDAKSPKKK